MGKEVPIRSTVLVVFIAITVAVGTGNGSAASTTSQSQTSDLLDADPILVAVGDIAPCSSEGDEATAALLDGLPGTIATLGDHVYQNGTPREFARCYDPSWGRHRDRTRPAPGNHDYETSGAAGYVDYFGAAGEPGKGYYGHDLGAWHIVVLNSNCSQVGGCGEETPQELWLREDLAAHPAA
jgi:acid phosphatase type 7